MPSIEQNDLRNRLDYGRKQSVLLPIEVVHVYDGLARAIELTKEGYGLATFSNHPSKLDSLYFMEFYIGQKELQGKRIGTAMSIHHWEHPVEGPVLKKISRQASIEVYPVVNQSTWDKGLAKGRPVNTGLKAFQNGVFDIFSEAGIVGLAVEGQTGNIDNIIKSMDNGGRVPETAGLFFADMDRRGIKFAIMFLGIAKPKGFSLHPLKRRILVGKTYTKTEVEDIVRSGPMEVEGKFYKSLNRWVLRELYSLIHSV